MRSCRHLLFIPLLAAFLLGSRPAYSQSSGIGLKGALQLDMSRASGGGKARPMLGGSLGLYGPIYAGPSMEVQPEVLLNMQARVFSDGEQGFTGIRFFYVQVPLSFKYYLGNTFNLTAGPQASKLILAQQFGDTTVNISHTVNKWDFGVNAGLGADLRGGWDFTLRYYSGISSVFKDEQVMFPVHRSTQVSIGYRFAKWRHQSRRGRMRK